MCLSMSKLRNYLPSRTYDLTIYMPWVNKVQAGGSFKVFRINYNAASPYGNDTPYSPVPGIEPFALSTRYRSYQTGAFLQATKNLTPRFDLTLGGRVDHYSVLGQTRFSPRAGVNYRLTGRLSWTASYGTYYQQPAFLFVSAFPENASLVPWRADHYVTGLAWTPSPGLRMTVEGYRKNYRDYPVARDLPSVSLANIGDTFSVREILFPLEGAGEGHSEGIEFFAEKRLSSKLYGQTNVSFSQTRHAASTASFAQARSTTRSYSIWWAATGSRRSGSSRHGSPCSRAGRTRPTMRRHPPRSGEASTTARASTPSERPTTAASPFASTAPSPRNQRRPTRSPPVAH